MRDIDGGRAQSVLGDYQAHFVTREERSTAITRAPSLSVIPQHRSAPREPWEGARVAL